MCGAELAQSAADTLHRVCRAGLQSIIGTDGFVRLMQERPQKAQSFLLQCVPAPMA